MIYNKDMDVEKIMKNFKLITFLNPYSMYILYEKRLLSKIYKEFDCIFIDGISLVKAIQFKCKVKNLERKSFDMTSLAPQVFEYAINNNKSIYLIGTKPNLIEKAVKNIKKIYPKLQIAGFRHGYFDNQDEYKAILIQIKDLNPDIVIAGMGTPLQEIFLLDLRNIGWKGIGFTCGGFLEQTANKIDYYPKIIDKLNLRWLYRLYREPKRLSKRYFYIYPKFFIKFFKGEINCEYWNYRNYRK